VKISVVTVCLNAELYIGQTLTSVASQTCHDVEHIVIDGGSTDSTLQIIKEAAEQNSALRWVSSKDNGISDAMNKGLTLATGDLISFLHADDVYSDNKVLENVAGIFNSNPTTEWLTGGIYYVNADGQILKNYKVRQWSYKRLLRGNTIFHPSTFVRREVLAAEGGFNSGLRYTMDYDLWLRLGKRSDPCLLDRPLACFRLHDCSLSVNQVDEAFVEELKVRFCYLQGRPLLKMMHLLYFAIKFIPNRLSMRT
jgi:glycosyltransferase involved in cell wall biosynthesis